MDSRDITVKPDRSSNFLEGIYELQKGLIDHYVKIEGLPPYPVNINTKASQVLLKDFTGRIIEELAEGFEAHLMVSELTHENLYWSGNLNPVAYGAMLNHLQNVGEEMADALHFFIELLVYTNIQPEDIVALAEKKTKVLNVSPEKLSYIMAIGASLLKREVPDLVMSEQGCNLLDLIQEGDYPLKEGEDKEEYMKYVTCGSIYSQTQLAGLKQALWDITYFLNIARNFLKNKPWKQSEVMTSEVKYQEQVVMAFILTMGYLQILGCDAEQVYFLYFKKNHINQFRIQSNY